MTTQSSLEGDLKRSVQWTILALLFFSTMLNYIDRQVLSILATTIQKDLKIDDSGYAFIVQMFLVAYTLAYLVVGRITDWLGSKLSLTLFVIWWSVANMMSGFTTGVASLAATRFALGLGEAGNYTAAPKIVSENFKPDQRALAVGIYTAGSMVGATLAPPLIGGVALAFGWRAAFVVTGALGIVWAIAWLIFMPKTPLIKAADPEPTADKPSEKQLWGSLLKNKTLWSFVLARMLADPVWYFYLFWMPKYLGEQRGLSLVALAATAWIIYLAADIGSLAGGAASGKLVRNGMNPVDARFKMIMGAALIVPLGALIGFEPPIQIVFALAAIVACAHLVFQVNLTTMVVDVFPQKSIGTTFSLVAFGSGLGGIISTGFVGKIASTGNYTSLFLISAILHPLALGCIWLGLKNRPKVAPQV
ncbi:MFS transporter [Aquidulcibacter sp.]|uniref:MFS transporter n=1 Tax=Aquidulcibacter sp. TaxID=2052990 RepID=UPI0025BBF1ED|nr:MFS transporter [Aquidulcibacter sp.]MCA3693088.1 MFS transporter [Aquidulcibacter sp.]